MFSILPGATDNKTPPTQRARGVESRSVEKLHWSPRIRVPVGRVVQLRRLRPLVLQRPLPLRLWSAELLHHPVYFGVMQIDNNVRFGHELNLREHGLHAGVASPAPHAITIHRTLAKATTASTSSSDAAHSASHAHTDPRKDGNALTNFFNIS